MPTILRIAFLLLLLSAPALGQDRLGQPADGGSLLGQPAQQRASRDTTRQKRTVGRLLDDSTKQVYGPHTTYRFTAADWLRQQAPEQPHPDTLLSNFHRYNTIERQGFDWQQLSAIASPGRPQFYRLPDAVGARLGIEALDYLLPSPQQFEFYDARSPYAYWQYAQGGGGRTWLDAAFARNINARSNAGFAYRRVISRPLVGLRTEGGTARQIDHQQIALHGHYTGPKGRYRLLSGGIFHRTILQETGGLSYSASTQDLDSLFSLDDGQLRNRLSGASGRVSGTRWFGQQSYRPFDSLGIRLFHEWHWETALHAYADDNALEGDYPEAYFIDDVSQEQIRMQQLQTRAGVSWRRRGFLMLGYYQLRATRWAHATVGNRQVGRAIPDEHYLGGEASWSPRKGYRALVAGEYLMWTHYRLEGELQAPWFWARLRQQRFLPSLAEAYYYGNHFRWNNRFESTQASELEGGLRVGNGVWGLEPGLRLLYLSQYVYFDENARPAQAPEAGLVQPRLSARAQAGGWRLDASARYTLGVQDSIMPMPRWHVQAQAYYFKPFFKGRLPLQLGIDFHWHSAYRAYAYQPLLRQFYLQQQFLVGNYPLLSLFANARVNRVKLFAKVTNLLQGLPKQGYFLTPGYMAQARSFEFGLVWMFFD